MTEYELRDRSHGLLWFGYDFKDRWSITDPCNPELHYAARTARYYGEKLSRDQLLLLLRAVEDYLHFATHPASTESIIKQLRALRRAVRDK